MKSALLLILVIWLLTGCASFSDDTFPSREELIGTYDMGDGLGICTQIALRADGSFKGFQCGGEHLSLPSREFSGTWSIEGAVMSFSTAGIDIGPAEAFYWKGAPAFVEIRDKRGDKVGTWAIFHRRAE